MDLDNKLKLFVILALALWNLLVGTLVETPYPESLVELYAVPLTRIFLLGLVLVSAYWCPNVGIMAALAYICLGADVIFFTKH